jgi:hypothetical protein
MNLKTTINSLGIVLTIVGVYIVYINSPLNFDTIDGGNFSTDFEEIKRVTNSKNKWMRNGVYIIIIGSLLQLVSNYIPDGKF